MDKKNGHVLLLTENKKVVVAICLKALFVIGKKVIRSFANAMLSARKRRLFLQCRRGRAKIWSSEAIRLFGVKEVTYLYPDTQNAAETFLSLCLRKVIEPN
jgi:hypothetical protein